MKHFFKSRPVLSYPQILALLFFLLFLSLLFSIVLGRYPIPFKELMGILSSFFLETDPFWSPVQESLLLNHRLPRILLACMVGCCLSAAGAAYQGIFQNPMAAPDILGASSGAAFGAALSIYLGLGKYMITFFAFLSGLLTVAAVVYVGNRVKGKRSMGLILSGIMISSFITSATSYLKLVADPQDQLPAITYWLMGSFNGTTPEDVLLALFPMVLGALPLLLFRWKINLLTLGEEEARTMGIQTKKLRLLVIVSSTLLTAASVAVSGMIGWVGLVIPNLTRRMVGNNYRYLLPASMLLGAVFLLMVDNISRNLTATEIPIGILTSFIGAPFFLTLISKGGERH